MPPSDLSINRCVRALGQPLTPARARAGGDAGWTRAVSAIAGDAASNDEALVRSTTRADVVDARRLDQGSIDRGLLVGLSRADEIGKK